MARILHLLDERAHPEALATLDRVAKAARGAGRHDPIALVGPASAPPRVCAEDVITIGRHWGRGVVASAWPVRQTVAAKKISLVHAWSLRAALVGLRAAHAQCPVIATLCEPPSPADVRGNWLRPGLARLTAAIAPSEALRAAFVTAGLEAERCIVIPPAIEYEAAADVGSRDSPSAGVGPRVLTAPPPSRAGGHYYAAWAVAILQQLWPEICIIVPGESNESDRLARFAASFKLPGLLVRTGKGTSFAALLRQADVFMMPATGPVPAGALWQAMRAGVPTVGSTHASVTEYVVDEQTALLAAPANAVALASQARRLLRDPALGKRLASAARKTAKRFPAAAAVVERYAAVYANLLKNGVPFTARTGPSAARAAQA
jgi:phosphatidylinositol alpha-mannosyltransferase